MKTWNLFFRTFCNLAVLFLFIAILAAAVYYPEVEVSLMIGFITFFCCIIGSILLLKSSPSYPMTITLTTLTALLLVLLTQSVTRQYLKYETLYLEILFVFSLWIADLFKRKVNDVINKEKIINFQISVRLDEFFRLINKCRIILSIHLMIVGIYHFCLLEYQTPGLTRFLFSQLSLCLIFVITAYWHIRVRMLSKELSTEEWLPIVNESGGVIGKITQSVAQTTKKHFLFPVVRIAVISENMLHLAGRDPEIIIEPGKTDTPFEKYVGYGQTLDDTVRQILNENKGLEDVEASFVLKYISKNPFSHRLTYLYVARIPSLQRAENISLKDGKWWHEKQIEDNLDKGIFSEFFEKEYEILKNTILLVQRMAK